MRPIAVKSGQLLTPDECNEIVSMMRPLAQRATTMNTANPLKNAMRRRSSVAWITNGSPLDHYVERVLESVFAISCSAFDVRISDFEAVQFAEYSAFCHYGQHKDVGTSGPDRIISAIVELSDPNNHVGGGLWVDIDGDKNIGLKQGEVAVFPSLLNHGAKMVFAGKRYSLAIWGRCRA